MDSYFKAAVCDLDKLLDDFELNTEELDCRPVFLKPPPQQCLSSKESTLPPSLPDLNSLHYGASTSCPEPPLSHPCSNNDGETKGQPLTGVDLLSSVDHRPAKTSALPCPDQAPKPVCDLVNDTGSAVLVRANSHDAFSELDVVEKQMEEEQELDEGLLVDFESPVVMEDQACLNCSGGCEDLSKKELASGKNDLLSLGFDEQGGAYSASLSLLDVILPAAAETDGESAVDSLLPMTGGLEEVENKDCEKEASSDRPEEGSIEEEGSTCAWGGKEDTRQEDTPDKAEIVSSVQPESATSDKPASLSCLPLAASICGALGQSTTREEEPRQASEQSDEENVSESTEADSFSALGARQGRSCSEQPVYPAGPVCQQSTDGRLSPEGQHVSVEATAAVVALSPDPNSSDHSETEPSEFGFEYLPESDQAELLVTDEELDAFLQAHTEAEQARNVSFCSNPGACSRPENVIEPNRNPEGVVWDEEQRNCGGDQQEELEGLAFPESDRRMFVSSEACVDPGAPSQPQEYCSTFQEPENFGARHSLTSHTFPSQQTNNPDQQPSFGGARPKQLHCQTARSPPAGEEEDREQTLSKWPNAAEDEESPPMSVSLTEEDSKIRDANLIYVTQEQQDYGVGYDELSEPPPYHGEPPSEGARSVNWKKEEMEELGCRQPEWVPDAQAPNCMKCYQRFTFTKRRHHCRACGKVFCAVCCSRKCKLKYLEKEARVCVLCFDTIHKAQALERMMSPTGPSPNPNIPSEYCSTIPPLQQARAAGTLNSPPPTVMVPVSVLKHPNNDSCPREQKRVWFADGILPNGEVADTTKLSVTSRRSSQEFSGGMSDQTTSSPAGSEEGVSGSSSSSSFTETSGTVEVVRPRVSGPWDYGLLSGMGSLVKRLPSLLPDNDELPPLLFTTGEDNEGDVLIEDNPALCQILHLLEEGGPRPLAFVLNANLLVNVKLVTYLGRQCWCFGSNGLQALGQRELVFLLECLPEEKSLPKDLFTLYLTIYQDAQKGKFVEEMNNVTFTSSFLGSKDHAGMLFFSHTFQPLDGLTLPPRPFLFGLLIQKLEVPWAKVFPLRLLLRLGAKYSVYPTSLISVRFRESVYRETGHTIMNLLADLRNYQYSLSVVEGLQIHMEMGHSYINIPKRSFNEMQKVINTSNEHVISIGATFSLDADSHLVCVQNEDGNYQTQANSMPGKTRTVTGASFVVFNGALKASSGFIAKSSIVEDGMMIQIPPETMESLRSALREQTDFHIACGRNDGGEIRENVTVRWVDCSSPVNTGKTSGVDGRPLDGVHSVRIKQDADFESDGRTIACTEVFYEPKSPDCSLASVLSSSSVFQKEMAVATCSALSPHLAVLTNSGINCISLRVSTEADMVEYQACSGGRLLPQHYMNELDSALIPVIHGGGASVPQTALDMEFTFYITSAI